MKKNRLSLFLGIILTLCGYLQAQENVIHKKVILCGICRNTETGFYTTVHNMEQIGSYFKDYAVVIYENNSTDNTATFYQYWAKRNPKVTFVSETIPTNLLPSSRTEKIALARNSMLDLIRDEKFDDFDYVIMADLDFTKPWPVEEIINTINSPLEWDCVTANGILNNNQYFDRYAFRDKRYPFGPEILGDYFWEILNNTLFFYNEEKHYVPVYSAFGGLAIYKRASLIPFSYSGIVTENLRSYYGLIASKLSSDNFHLLKYREFNNLWNDPQSNLPIIFRDNTACDRPSPHPVTCCEHVPLQASMAMHGFGKFYVNTKMKMRY